MKLEIPLFLRFHHKSVTKTDRASVNKAMGQNRTHQKTKKITKPQDHKITSTL